ncbi:MAG: metallopeptidase family protein [Actinomycetota bacterium]|nr:metallopeptidase family protein [Actinomycetota bacterium]
MMDDRHARFRRRDLDRRRGPSDGFRLAGVRRFERIVDSALASLPAKLLAYLENVQIVVEDVPSPQSLVRDGILLGLYQGVPRTARACDPPVLPDRITLFRRAIESRVTNKEELLDLVREVVVHELAHHLGIDEDRLDELGW